MLLDNHTKTGAKRLAWNKPDLRRFDASDAQTNDNMKGTEQLNGGPHPGTGMSPNS